MKSRILNPKRMKQLIDFKGLELDGGIYPTDIDGIVEYRDSEYIILEVKHHKAKVPWGQRLCLQRMVDDFTKTGKNAVAIVCEHEVDKYPSVGAVNSLGARDDVHGILVQLPLPEGIDANWVIASIPPEKDVDALTPVNMGKLILGTQDFAPCTPTGILTILDAVCGSISGANCVVIGRSNIVGKPMSIMLTQRNATVTLCHSHTEDLPDIASRADILISAVGKAGFVTADMVKKDAIVIDVGINRDKNGRLCGDVCFDEVLDKVDAITPVPGGVGIMTVTSLLENTLKAAELSAR